jgi:DNA (cytosine-5)-methyltransferase 1
MYLSKVKIKEMMEQQGIKTFAELAKRMRITKNQLSVMLSDGYNPLKTRVNDLCTVLKVHPDEIMDFVKINSSQLLSTVSEESVTAIELFAGAGGLALGLEQAGICTVEYVEFDKACCGTLKTNRPKWNVICDDIHNVDFTEYSGQIDIVTGGFPCQAFSYAGKKLGFEDTRGTLFHEFARCVQQVRPKMFLAENVRGLVSHDKGRTLQTIIEVLKSLEYSIQYKILNAAYYGVGQKRERIVIIGIRDDLPIDFSFPIPDEKMTTLRQVLKDCPASPGEEYSEKKRKVLELVPAGGCWVDLPEDVAKNYMGKSYYSGGGRRGMARRINWDEPCLTLTCSPSQKQTERCHPEETRPFTVREYARIQSFPDDWKFCGGIGDQYKQIGNAVPVEMARRIGVQLKEAILKYNGTMDTI